MPNIAMLVTASAIGAMPIGDPQSWITSDDYPASAVEVDAEGSSQVQLAIDASGAIVDCIVSQSSGSTELDVLACSLLRERAKFTAGRDANGKAVPSHYMQIVRWHIPRDELISKGFRMTQAVDSTGRLLACKVSFFGKPEPGVECEPEILRIAAETYLKHPLAHYQNISVTMAMQVDDDAQINLFRSKTEERSVLTQARVRVSADGIITQCTPETVGQLAGRSLDMCEGLIEVGAPDFEPDPNGLERELAVSFEVSGLLR